MKYKPKDIITFFSSKSVHPMKFKELSQAMNVPQPDYTSFRRMVKGLIDSGELVRLSRGRIGPPDQLNVLVGEISINRSGVGFLPREEKDDVMIGQYDLQTALDGDRVLVRLTGHSNDRQLGQVVRVIERPARNIVGTFHKSRTLCYVVPDNPRLHKHFYIPPAACKKAHEGEKVVAVLTSWNHPSQNPEGKIIERIGFPGEPGVDMMSILRSHNYERKFPPKVLSEAERSAAKDIEKEIKRRVDFRNEPIYTIDPVDAKDFDDAVSVTRTKQGYRLGVHIADVSFFVKEGGTLDREALERGNSVYLPGMVIPMLPEVLSNDVCSLRPDRVRLTHSAIIDFDKTGKVIKWKICDGVIKSTARFTYQQVEDFFNSGKPDSDKISELADNLTLARELAQKLTHNRMKNGAIDFDLPETTITLNEKGEVLELLPKVRLETHRLVEEFMLMANQVVALDLFRKGLQSLYRVHGRPELEKLEAFSDTMSKFGHKFPASPTVKPAQISRFLNKVKGLPEAEFVNELLLRSMQKAVYQRPNIGHFGLAFSHYTHFTSPIRRYADLLVHRLIRKSLTGTYPIPFAKKVNALIDTVGTHISETEIQASRAEREAIKVKQLEYMEKFVGEEFSGMISGVMPFGFFVRLNGVGAQGLIRLSAIDDDYYAYDEKMYRIVGRRGGAIYRLGDQVKVIVVKVDRTANELDLQLISDGKKKSGRQRTGSGRGKSGSRMVNKFVKGRLKKSTGSRPKKSKKNKPSSAKSKSRNKAKKR